MCDPLRIGEEEIWVEEGGLRGARGLSEDREPRQVSVSHDRCQSDNFAETYSTSQKFGQTFPFPFRLLL